MKVCKGSWHANLYRRAYIDDRSWVVGEVYKRPWSGLDEAYVDASNAVLVAWNAYWNAPRNQRQPLREAAIAAEQVRDEAYAACREANEAWYAECLAASKATVQERFESGRLSLCPYFWSVVLACLVYVPIVRPLRWLAQRVSEAGAWLWAHRRGVAVVATLVVVIVGALWTAPVVVENRDAVVQTVVSVPAKAVSAIDAYQARRAESKAIEARQTEAEARAAAERDVWRATHAEEAAQQDAAHADQRRRAAERARVELWQDFQGGGMVLGIFALCFVVFLLGVVVLSIAFAVAGVALDKIVDGVLTLVVLAIVIPLDSSPRFKRAMERFEAWLAARRERRRQHGEARARWWQETWTLVTAFLKARKERVCPFLTFVDEREGEPQR